MKSTLALVESQFRNNTDSQEAAAAKSKVLADMYDKQTAKVEAMDSALKNAKTAQAEYASAVEQYKTKLAGAEEELQKLQGSTGDTTAEQKRLSEEITKLNAGLKESSDKEQVASKSINDWQKQLNYAKRDLNGLSDEIDENARSMDDSGKAVVEVVNDLDEYGKAAKSASSEQINFSDESQRSGDAVNALAAALAASGIKQSLESIKEALTECTESAKVFQSGMAEVYTLLPDASKKSKDKLSEDMLKFSGDMNVLTSDAVPALYQAISASVPADNVFSFMETAQKAAVGGVTGLETSVDGLTSIVNAYGSANITAEQTADMMFTTVRLGKTNFEQLSGSIYNVVPTAAAAKVGFDQVSAALAVITAQGVPTSVATTQMRQMLVELADSGSEVGKTFSQVAGVGFKDFIARGGNLQQVLQKLDAHAQQNRKSVNELFSSVEAGSSALQLTGQATESFTKALSEMANSAGATDKAYQTMTETAEYAEQRATVAFENVKTAVGNVLLPAFVDLKNGTADAFMWVADLIEEEPQIVSAISGIAIGVGGFTIAVTGLTIAQKASQVMTQLWGASLMATPTGQIALAVGILAGAVAAVGIASADAGDETTKSFSEMTEAAKTAKDTVKDSKKAYDDTTASTMATAEVARKYVDKLEALETQGLKTKEAHAEYAGTVKQLNALMPDLNLQINEQTGLIEGNTAMLRGNIEAIKQQAIEQAYQEKYGDALKAYGAVQVEIEENEYRLTEAKRAEAEATQEQEAIIKQMNERSAELEAQRQRESEQIGVATTATAENDAQYMALSETLAECGERVSSARDEQEKANGAIQEGQEAAAACEEAVDGLSARYGETSEATDDASDSTADLTVALSDAQKAYDETADAALESINKQIGQWEKMDNKTTTSTKTLNDNLESQIKYLDNYSTNLTKLSDSGIANVDTLVAVLSDGSTESAAIVAGLVRELDNGSKDGIEKLIANMGKVDEGKKVFSETVASISTEYKTAMVAMQEEAKCYDQMFSNGADTMQGLVNGVRSKKKSLQAAMKEITDIMSQTYKKENNQNSPSKKYEAMAKDTLQGAVNGIKAKEDDLKGAMKEAVDLAIEAFGDDNEEAVQLAKDFLDEYNNTLKMTSENAAIFADITKKKLGEIQDAMEEVEKKQESMQKKLQEYGDLFSVDKNGYMSLDSLDEQIGTLNEYEKTLSKLKENGISQGLLDEVVGMGVDDAIQYGQKLIQMYDNSPDKWEEYNAKWQEKQDTAKRIAEEFYKTELDTLKTEFSDELERGLDDLKMITFDSGEDAMKRLIDGLRSKKQDLYDEANAIASQLRSIINSALSTSGSSKNGSHALGLDYVPFDGYVAELHKGERVLTADETRAYIAARTPSSFDIPAQQQIAQQQTAALVNAIGMLTAGASESVQDSPATIILQTSNGDEMARWLLPSIREASKQSPEVERDF